MWVFQGRSWFIVTRNRSGPLVPGRLQHSSPEKRTKHWRLPSKVGVLLILNIYIYLKKWTLYILNRFNKLRTWLIPFHCYLGSMLVFVMRFLKKHPGNWANGYRKFMACSQKKRYLPFKKLSMPQGRKHFSSWWLNQPIWKICSSNWDHFPK